MNGAFTGIWTNSQTIISPYIKHRAAGMEMLPVMDKSSNYNFAIAKLSVGYCMLSPSIKHRAARTKVIHLWRKGKYEIKRF